MSSLREPGLGPIVGHTTDDSCRLWIRASDPADRKADLADERRTLGVLTVLSADGQIIPIDQRPVFYFRLRREYDRTGTFNLGKERSLGEVGDPFPLMPNTQYTVKMATLSLDDPLPNDEDLPSAELVRRLPDRFVWRGEFERLSARTSEATFRTFGPASQVAETLSVLLGSCRYPGVLWLEREADQIFGPMLREARRDGNPCRLALMVGDQVYADLLNRLVPIGRADTFEEFQERYHTAYGSSSMRELLRQLPTYMILDDHEIEDNWTQDRVAKQVGRELFLHAVRAYLSYQWSHGPRTWLGRLYYTFACDGYPFFVLDTRTQRYVDDIEDDLDDNHLLGRPSLDPSEPSQLDRLLAWLSEQQETLGPTPKFIVSASVFVPNSVASTKSDEHKVRDDSWPAFPETRRALLRHIVTKKIQNVVFLSGDIHCSNVAEISFAGSAAAAALTMLSVTSSAFYWPFPFANGDAADYVHDSTDRRTRDSFQVTRGVTMDYRASGFTQEDNYCRLDLDRRAHTLTVRVFDWRGDPVKRPDGTDLVSVLNLGAW
jgi:alkaline phosphatase D